MDKFFTSQQVEEIVTPLPIHLVLFTVLIAGIIGTILWYKRNPENKVFIIVIALLQLTEFLALNIWYRISGYMAYPLPLFHCRIAKIFLILFALLPKRIRERLRPLYIYSIAMAFFGAVSSFVYPDPDPFLWPHITNIGYFFGHFNLGVLSIAHLMEDKKRWGWRDLFTSQVLLLAFNLAILPIARSTGINYSYLLESPLFNEWMQAFGANIYVLLMLVAYAALFSVAFIILKAIDIKVKRSILVK